MENKNQQLKISSAFNIFKIFNLLLTVVFILSIVSRLNVFFKNLNTESFPFGIYLFMITSLLFWMPLLFGVVLLIFSKKYLSRGAKTIGWILIFCFLVNAVQLFVGIVLPLSKMKW